MSLWVHILMCSSWFLLFSGCSMGRLCFETILTTPQCRSGRSCACRRSLSLVRPWSTSIYCTLTKMISHLWTLLSWFEPSAQTPLDLCQAWTFASQPPTLLLLLYSSINSLFSRPFYWDQTPSHAYISI